MVGGTNGALNRRGLIVGLESLKRGMRTLDVLASSGFGFVPKARHEPKHSLEAHQVVPTSAK
jgi:hypothetical protein